MEKPLRRTGEDIFRLHAARSSSARQFRMFLVVGRGLEDRDSPERKIELDRMAGMLSRLGKRGYSLQEESPDCRIDFDSDFVPDETDSQSGPPALSFVALAKQDSSSQRLFSAFSALHRVGFSGDIAVLLTPARFLDWGCQASTIGPEI